MTHRLDALHPPADLWRTALQGLAAVGVGLALGALALWGSPWIALSLVAGIGGAALLARYPELGLLALVAITGLVNTHALPVLSLGPVSLHITDLILTGLLALVGLRALLDPAFKPVRTPLDAPLLLLVGGLVLTTMIGIVEHGVAMNFAFRRLRNLVYYLAFFAVTALIRDRRQLDRLIAGLFAIALWAAAGMVVQIVAPAIRLVYIEQPDLVTAGRAYHGVVRTYTEADRLGYVLFIVAVALAVVGSVRGLSRRAVVAAAVLGVGLFLSYQRNYWMTAAAALGLLLVMAPWTARRRYARMAAAVLVGVLLIASVPGTGLDGYVNAAIDRVVFGLNTDTLSADDSTQLRVTENAYALASIEAHPLTGIGLGNFYRPMLPRDEDAADDPENGAGIGLRWYIHNGYFWVLVFGGLISFVPFVWLYARFVLRSLTCWRHLHTPRDQALVLGIGLAILGQCISNAVSPNFVQSWSLVVYAIAMGIAELIVRWDAPSALPDARAT